MSSQTKLTYESKVVGEDVVNVGILDGIATFLSRTEDEADIFLVSAHDMLESVPYCEGQDCIVVCLQDMRISDVMDGPRDICAGVATLWYGHHPCLMLNDGLIGLDAETILDADIEVGEPLLIVFGCEDGCVLTRTDFTSQLETQLKAIVAAKDFLPTPKVGDDGQVLGRTKHVAIYPGYYGSA